MRPSVILTTLAVLAASCSHSEPAPAVPSSPAIEALGERVSFAYRSVDEAPDVTSASMRGRPTILIFLSTFDLASQAQARFLSMVAKRHRPPIHAAAIALEPKENRELVAMFRQSLGLEYPVALGDEELIAGRGPFGDVRAVPATVVLDADGRIVARREGLLKDDELEAMLGER